MLKKIVYFKLVILLLILIGITVFILTFDINRYKPEVETKLSEALGYPVKIESLSLSLHKGLAVQVKGLSLNPADGQFFIYLDRFFLIAELKPLLRRQIKITQCLIESPRVELRGSQALPVPSSQVSLVSPTSKVETISTPVSSTPPDIQIPYVDELQISRIVISDGEVILGDAQNEYRVNDIDLILTDVALESPTGFQGSCKFNLGLEKQINVKGTLVYPDQTIQFFGAMDQVVEVKGTIANFMRVPVYQIEIALKGLDLSSFYTLEQRRLEHIAGRVHGHASLLTSGK